MVGVGDFDMVHKAVYHSTECILHRRRAVEMAAVANRCDWGEYRVNRVGPH